MGEGDRTGEWGRAGGPGGASLRSSALFPLTQPPSLQGDVVFLFLHPHLLVRASFPRGGFLHLCQHSQLLRSRVGEKLLGYHLQVLTKGRRRLREQGSEYERLKWEILDPGAFLLLPPPSPHIPTCFGLKGIFALFESLR